VSKAGRGRGAKSSSVNVHLHMLRMQLMGQTPNKAEHNRQLQTMLPALETPAEAPLLEFVRTFRRCAARRPKAFNAVALNGGARIDNIRKARSRVSATVYTAPDASRCAFSSTAVVPLQ